MGGGGAGDIGGWVYGWYIPKYVSRETTKKGEVNGSTFF